MKERAKRDSTIEFDILWKHVPTCKNENHILGERESFKMKQMGSQK
jgi:hypothetical protein